VSVEPKQNLSSLFRESRSLTSKQARHSYRWVPFYRGRKDAIACRNRQRAAVLPLLTVGLLLLAWVPVSTANADGVSKGAEQQSGNYPPLGNTPEADKTMSIEISDQLVWEPSGSLISDAQRQNINLWDKIATSNRMPLQLTPVVEEYKKRLKKKHWSYEKILKRASPFLYHIVNRLEARGLPLDLVLLPVIESGYQTHVKSENQAAGLWQIVPATAQEIGLRRNAWYDERSDYIKSTRAALDYLSFINAEFDGNWEHTLAAYNAGPGRVRSAIRRNAKKGLSTDFWHLRLPTETSVYVARFAALAELVRQTPTSALELPEVAAKPWLEEVDAGQRISLDIAAEITGISEKRLRRYNGGLLYGVTAPKGPHKLMMPSPQAQQFGKAVASYRKSGRTLFNLPQTHKVKAGESIGSIALKYKISQRKLRELNGLDNDLIRIGQKLAVVSAPGNSAKSAAKTKQAAANVAEGPAVGYTIQSGDTLSEIALKFKVAIDRIRLENGKVPNAKRLIPGQKLQIYRQES